MHGELVKLVRFNCENTIEIVSAGKINTSSLTQTKQKEVRKKKLFFERNGKHLK
jgi:hypothetical protein